jgi:restriction endonuclease S subunit
MRYERYKNYKNSGIDWLGEVPDNWEVWKASHGFELIGSGTTPRSENLGYYDGDIPWVTTSELRENIINDTFKKLTADALKDYSALKMYPIGTLLIAMYGATIGRLGILGISATVNQACCAFVKPKEFDTRFVFYWLQYRKPIIISLSSGGGQPNLNREELCNIRIPVPDLDEQRAIAFFLDRETERIDSLIEKKQRQIELLQKKRAALISQAVTKGLDPNVKMKDSGVQWLGKVPEHWIVSRIKYCGRIKYGLGEPPAQKDDGLPFVRATDIDAGKISLDAVNRVDPSDVPWSRDPSLKANDILVVRSGAYTGDSAIVPPELEGSIAGYDMVLRVSNGCPEFVAYALLSKYILDGQIMLERMRAAQPHLNAEELGSMILLLPPFQEQIIIAEYLDKECAKNQELMVKIKQSIECSERYRTALISAAVTGKIDVRNEVEIPA